MDNYIIVIPARFQSSRLPGKPLVTIAGVSLLERTWRQCCLAVEPDKIVIATDDDRIVQHAESFGAIVKKTPTDCNTGTDRVASLLVELDYEYFINVQGDEPLINPNDIKLMIEACKMSNHEILNGYSSIKSEEQFFSPHIPKLVMNHNEELMYMSRAPIPIGKPSQFEKAWRQICIYGFSRKALTAFVSSEGKTLIEGIEDIEIIRFLELGFKVKMIKMSAESVSIDRPEDVVAVEKILAKRNSNV